MANLLGVDPRALRGWLREQWGLGHPLVARHEKHARWEFGPQEAERLMREFAARRTGRPSSSVAVLPGQSAGTGAQPAPSHHHPRSQEPGHRVLLEWMGDEVETLADLLRPGLRAAIVGINPSPKSVAAGHYYQGSFGLRLWTRLTMTGLLPQGDGFDDDRAFSQGIGFTDLVKRPTARSTDVRTDEIEHGRVLLEEKLAALFVPLIIFAFKAAATPLLGRFDGHGSLGGRRLAGARIFVMPGPMERTDRVDRALASLSRLAQTSGP